MSGATPATTTSLPTTATAAAETRGPASAAAAGRCPA